ncbi:MAG: hypothetical protein HYS12_01595 [Planctomycetes bacterium]|nr:hypothetical protein [Planctomycetota bacterium]
MSDPSNAAKVIEAEKFVLRDSSGKVRAELGDLGHDSIGLRLFDGEGRERAVLLVAKDGAVGLQLSDDTGFPRAMLGLDPDSPHIATPVFSLNSREGIGGLALYVSPDGVSGLDFRNKLDEDGVGLTISGPGSTVTTLDFWAGEKVVFQVPPQSGIVES